MKPLGKRRLLEPMDLGESTCWPPPSMSMDEYKPIREMAICLVVEPTPLKNMTVVSWDHDIPNWMESHKVHVPKHQPNVLRSDRARDFFVQFSMNQQPLWGGWGSHPLTNSLGQHSTGDGIKKKNPCWSTTGICKGKQRSSSRNPGSPSGTLKKELILKMLKS